MDATPGNTCPTLPPVRPPLCGVAPLPPAGVFPSVPPDTARDDVPPPWQGSASDQEGAAGRYSYYSSRPEAPSWKPDATAANPHGGPGVVAFAKTSKSAGSDPPPPHVSLPTGLAATEVSEPHLPGGTHRDTSPPATSHPFPPAPGPPPPTTTIPLGTHA